MRFCATCGWTGFQDFHACLEEGIKLEEMDHPGQCYCNPFDDFICSNCKKKRPCSSVTERTLGMGDVGSLILPEGSISSEEISIYLSGQFIPNCS